MLLLCTSVIRCVDIHSVYIVLSRVDNFCVGYTHISCVIFSLGCYTIRVY